MRALVLLVLVAGCTPAPSPDPAPSSDAPSSPAAAPTCPATADLPLDGERQGRGDSDGVTLWALFFGPKVIAGQEIKVAWRMTGAGDLTMTAQGPDGRLVKPSWGPEEHGGSTFARPGDEWGTGWVFPRSGCWTVHATRSTGRAHLVLRVG
ncbi:hypothetical protein GCM10010172_17460 [Paractinoplanes ferrugineus]|uniref:Secreted protein n=1 Tax=Paractinoplanes ferrugineus TaxID=113564 RepID=A0A919J6T0_9ACTN|nr:hypothetical protein Afe05nite_34860 [Actinoplanes ferrugineus]